MQKGHRHKHSVDVIAVEPLFNSGKLSLAYITYDIYGRGEDLEVMLDANFVFESVGSFVVCAVRLEELGE